MVYLKNYDFKEICESCDLKYLMGTEDMDKFMYCSNDSVSVPNLKNSVMSCLYSTFENNCDEDCKYCRYALCHRCGGTCCRSCIEVYSVDEVEDDKGKQCTSTLDQCHRCCIPDVRSFKIFNHDLELNNINNLYINSDKLVKLYLSDCLNITNMNAPLKKLEVYYCSFKFKKLIIPTLEIYTTTLYKKYGGNFTFKNYTPIDIINPDECNIVKIFCQDEDFNEDISKFVNIEVFWLTNVDVSSLPDNLTKLKRLDVSKQTTIREIPNTFVKLTRLDALGSNLFVKIPNTLINLVFLDIRNTSVSKIHDTFINIKYLFCSGTQLSEIPDTLINLIKLDITDTDVKEIPRTLTQLEELECNDNFTVDELINSFPNLKILTI